MKIVSLHIVNVGMVADETITFDKPLVVLYGEVRQGKSTFLNAIRWLVGKWPTDIIRHGQTEALIELRFNEGKGEGMLSRSWYVAKDKAITARAHKLVRPGNPSTKPSAFIERFVNPFTLEQDHLRNMNEIERRAYFRELLGVDTAGLDLEASVNSTASSNLRAKIKGYGEIDLTPVPEVEVEAIQRKLADARVDAGRAQADWEADCETLRVKNANAQAGWRDDVQAARERLQQREQATANVAALTQEIARLTAVIEGKQQWLKANPPIPVPPSPLAPQFPDRPTPPDTSALERQLAEAAATQERRKIYLANVDRARNRDGDEKELRRLEDRGRAIKSEKAAALSKIAGDCKIDGLAFDEEGNFVFEGTQAGMLSTSQIMRLSSALSALYPEGFGLELLDRGESLGRAIFEYVKHAEAHKTSVLATVVGERPADVPEKVGVFIVKDGVIWKDAEGGAK